MNGKNKGASVEKCARIGLFSLLGQTTQAARGTPVTPEDAKRAEEGLVEFHNQVKREYAKTLSPKLSKWKITLSVLSLGLLPLINVVVAIVKSILTKQKLKQLQAMDRNYTAKVQKYVAERSPEVNSENPKEVLRQIEKVTQALKKEDFTKDYLKRRAPIQLKFYDYIKGVPFEPIQLKLTKTF